MGTLIKATQPAAATPTGAKLLSTVSRQQLTENMCMSATDVTAGTYFVLLTMEVFGRPPMFAQLPGLKVQFNQPQADSFGVVQAAGLGTTTLPPLTAGQVATASVQFTHTGGPVVISVIKGIFPPRSVNQLIPSQGQWFYSATAELFLIQ